MMVLEHFCHPTCPVYLFIERTAAGEQSFGFVLPALDWFSVGVWVLVWVSPRVYVYCPRGLSNRTADSWTGSQEPLLG